MGGKGEEREARGRREGGGDKKNGERDREMNELYPVDKSVCGVYSSC
jgi:hypothetical protein